MKTTAANYKQFDLSHIHIDEKLQGARLASFPRRFIAFGIDWAVIWVTTHFIIVIFPLLALLFLFKGKLKDTLVKSRRIIKRQVLSFGKKLEENTTIEPELKRRFTRGITIYMYILLYLPIIFISLYFFGMIFESLFPQTYQSTINYTSSFGDYFIRPVADLTNAVKLLSRFLGAFVYFSIFTWKWQGQTLGKRLMKIKIVKLNGTPISFWNSLERASGYTASAAILFLGFFQYFWDRNAQTTHDKITETIVVDVVPGKLVEQ
ncbi:MAG: RDD family protein [Bacteroidota bacterium]|nr:RDD family protein [Bacteroidota bacterium]